MLQFKAIHPLPADPASRLIARSFQLLCGTPQKGCAPFQRKASHEFPNSAAPVFRSSLKLLFIEARVFQLTAARFRGRARPFNTHR